MRDTLTDFDDDPVRRAQKHSAPELPKRFYKSASIEKGSGGFQLLLDSRSAKTPAKKPLAVTNERFATQMAKEWSEQVEHIDPAKMPYTRLANSAIDGVSAELEAVSNEIANFANSDLLFYRAGQPEGLVQMQRRHWDPILEYVRETYDAKFVLAEGMMFVEQPSDSVARITKAVRGFHNDYLALAGLQVMTAISGSVLIALGAAKRFLSVEDAWAAAHVDEDWNISEWGSDEEAEARRAYRWGEFQVALMAAHSLSDE
ncbi:MAG: ATP12 family protein [Hyphomicrobiales bacterium]